MRASGKSHPKASRMPKRAPEAPTVTYMLRNCWRSIMRLGAFASVMSPLMSGWYSVSVLPELAAMAWEKSRIIGARSMDQTISWVIPAPIPATK